MNLRRGFTIVEVIIVIAIIGVISSILMISADKPRANARMAQRLSDLRAVATALELYRQDNGSYPINAVGPAYYASECTLLGGNGWPLGSPDTVIPGLSPSYISEVPSDPAMDIQNNRNCYVYISDGTKYKFMSWTPGGEVSDISATAINNFPALKDPMRNGAANCDGQPADLEADYLNINGSGNGDRAVSVYSLGGKCLY